VQVNYPATGVALEIVGALSGDLDGDCDVDLDDAPPFTAVLLGTDTDPEHIAAADIDGSGSADGLDIQPFVDLLLDR
jgi:hypothetical protein